MTEAQQDIRWLIARCGAVGLPKPDDGQMEAFAERVAIRVEAGFSDDLARVSTFNEQFGLCQVWGTSDGKA